MLILGYSCSRLRSKVHRIIPSRFPPVELFDWAHSPDELEEIAALEGLTNDRLRTEYGDIYLVSKEDWIGGPGSTPVMAAFTHPGFSRFTDGTYGVYYAGSTLEAAIAETKFHRERFLSASNEAPCMIQMRQYIANVKKALVDICKGNYRRYLNPDPDAYTISQSFGRKLRTNHEWGLLYPSVRKANATCVAIFRPPALTIPTQGCHLDYVWDGEAISDIRRSKSIK